MTSHSTVNPQAPEFEYFASCLAGAEQALACELKKLHTRHVRPLGGGVAFFGTPEVAERVCLWSRLASRVLLVAGRVNAGDAELMYAGVRNIAWEDILSSGKTMVVRVHGTNDELRNTHFTALKVKDAICDRLREVRDERPEIDSANPDAVIDVRVRDNRATVSFDLVGDSLHKRAYFDERDGEDAPLSVATAASLLAECQWHGFEADRKTTASFSSLVDPVCDEGYLLVEAGLAACAIAPSSAREKWGFFAWAAHDEDVWADLLAEADDKAEEGISQWEAATATKMCLVGLSASSPAVKRARGHVRRAGLRNAVSVEFCEAGNVAATVLRVSDAAAESVVAYSQSGEEAEPGMLVISTFPLNRDSADARAMSEAAAFIAAASQAPASSRFAVANGAEVESRYGADATRMKRFGKGRIATQIALYDAAPVEPCIVMIPDNAGGAEHRVEVLEPTTDQFVARLRKVAKERRKWARREGIGCYRVYDADLPDYNAAIDIYEGAGEAEGTTYVHVAEYQAPKGVDEGRARRRMSDILTVIPHVLDVRPDHVFSKVREKSRGGGQYARTTRRNYVTYTSEDGLLFEVDLNGYLDTGLFLDHRSVREYVGSLCRNKSFLNLFAYTGSATVHAAAGGASRTMTVDLSGTYLEWAWRNLQLNGFTGSQHELERADVIRWITEARRAGERYDVIFVDPPTFSNSKSMGSRTFDVQRDHVELLIGVSRLLSEGGVAVFSCNLRNFKPDFEQLEKYGVALEDVSEKSIPHDFARNGKIHKCYVVRRV